MVSLNAKESIHLYREGGNNGELNTNGVDDATTAH